MKNGLIEVCHVTSKKQLADILAKPFGKGSSRQFVKALYMMAESNSGCSVTELNSRRSVGINVN